MVAPGPWQDPILARAFNSPPRVGQVQLRGWKVWALFLLGLTPRKVLPGHGISLCCPPPPGGVLHKMLAPPKDPIPRDPKHSFPQHLRTNKRGLEKDTSSTSANSDLNLFYWANGHSIHGVHSAERRRKNWREILIYLDKGKSTRTFCRLCGWTFLEIFFSDSANE